MEIQKKITQIYAKMQRECTQEMIRKNLTALFEMYNEEQLHTLYESMKKSYNENKQHYDSKRR